MNLKNKIGLNRRADCCAGMAKRHFAHFQNAFTLAETLIALVVIGVVAAIVLGSVIPHVQNTVIAR